MIRRVESSDALAICNIYNHYVENTNITFEETRVTEDDMKGRIAAITEDYPWFVYEEDGEVLGYAYAGKFRGRTAYSFTTESSIYIKNESRATGIGTKLYKTLIRELQERKFHVIIGCLAYPNDRSEEIHRKLGFEKIGHFKEVGFKFGQWIDTVYWQLIL